MALGRRGARSRGLRRVVLLGQGSYYLVTGIWPLLHYPSFEKITGPKTDDWLVKTIGATIAVVGAVLLWAGARRIDSRECLALSLGTATSLSAAELTYVAKGRISPVYAGDAILHFLFAGLLLAGSLRPALDEATTRRTSHQRDRANRAQARA